MAYLYLTLAIVAEVIATNALKATDGLTQLKPTLLCVAAYVVCFGFFALSLRTIPVGVAYAIWSGVGIIFITLVASVLFNQQPDIAAMAGMGLIIAGVVVIQVFSRTV